MSISKSTTKLVTKSTTKLVTKTPVPVKAEAKALTFTKSMPSREALKAAGKTTYLALTGIAIPTYGTKQNAYIASLIAEALAGGKVISVTALWAYLAKCTGNGRFATYATTSKAGWLGVVTSTELAEVAKPVFNAERNYMAEQNA